MPFSGTRSALNYQAQRPAGLLITVSGRSKPTWASSHVILSKASIDFRITTQSISWDPPVLLERISNHIFTIFFYHPV